MALAVLGISCSFGLLLSYLTWRDDPIMERTPWQLGTATIGLGLMVCSLVAALAEDLLGNSLATCIAVSLPMGVCYAYYSAGLVGHIVARISASAMSDGQVAVKPTFDRAEAAERTGELETAAELYREAIEADGSDPVPVRRLAEVLLRQEEVDEAMAGLRRAARLCEDVEAKALTVFRIAEVITSAKGDKAAAITELRKFASEHAGTTYASNAMARVQALS